MAENNSRKTMIWVIGILISLIMFGAGWIGKGSIIDHRIDVVKGTMETKDECAQAERINLDRRVLTLEINQAQMLKGIEAINAKWDKKFGQ